MILFLNIDLIVEKYHIKLINFNKKIFDKITQFSSWRCIMASKELFLGKYDLNLAITARKILIFETHKNEEIADLVWNPVLELLQDIQFLKPKSLTFCLFYINF
ncbi:MAG: hypothetical protein A3D35_00770 [Candidatus Staskawiczbacteria bacterium RIFCSPHIGHO2_02_FULL_34_9]|uniref:Uncharacterized protein n=1 Tax=Candidatus Staskawiczbacteria bacterium RIFCSPHIGHO2_02_FULL_34_9 TaxID=1802206 RepID=A0A1G2HXP2_9BACT|nr:MAG: hypothetical protein A3D35_00770 [Candidatus Staskawiczbacteria bacterium RIFCSPHIGHO2_02_FULL_34_9]